MTSKQPAPNVQGVSFPNPLNEVIDAAREKNAEDLIVLDLRNSSAFTDFFVICSGRSQKQVRAIAEGIEIRLKAMGTQEVHLEGYRVADWILIDYFDFVVHVFTPETRDFYSLESLWGSAVRVKL